MTELDLTIAQRKMLFAGFTSAKKTILHHWINPDLHMNGLWICSLHYIETLESTIARLNKVKPSTVDAWKCLSTAICDLYL